MKGERQNIFEKLYDLEPYFCGPTNPLDNVGVYQNCKFFICPKGNHNIECFRQYAACKNGSLPILLCSDKEWNKAYENLDIVPPWIHVPTVEAAKEKMITMKDDEIQSKQIDLLEWWDKMKLNIKETVDNVITH